VECNNDDFAEDITAWLNMAMGEDALGESLSVSNDFSDLTLSELECGDILLVEFKVSNSCGEATCESSILYLDETAPKVDCPDPLAIPVDVDDAISFIQDWMDTATGEDNCGEPTIGSDLILSELADLCELQSPYTVTFTAEDGCGNIDTCMTTISVLFPEAFVNCPDPIVLECNDENNDMFIAEWIAQGEGINVSNDFDPSSIINACESEQMVTFEALDECDEIVSCTSTILILDTTAPDITCPDDLEISVDAENPEATIQSWLDEVIALDACSGIFLENDFDSLTEISCDYEDIVEFTVIDLCDNSASCRARFSFVADYDVTLDCPTSIDIGCGDSSPDLIMTYMISAVISYSILRRPSLSTQTVMIKWFVGLEWTWNLSRWFTFQTSLHHRREIKKNISQYMPTKLWSR